MFDIEIIWGWLTLGMIGYYHWYTNDTKSNCESGKWKKNEKYKELNENVTNINIKWNERNVIENEILYEFVTNHRSWTESTQVL